MLPPLGPVLAFEAVARHLSVGRAAAELGVTSGAVSQRLKSLQTFLGVTLVAREGRGVALTEAGALFARRIGTAARLIREAAEELRERGAARALTVSCTPAFAVQWLVPRLPRLHAAEPSLDVRVSATMRLVDFARDRVDFAIRHGRSTYPGLVVERLLDDELVPICSPRLANRPRQPRDLAGHELLHDEHREDWRMWLEAVGAENVDWRAGPVLTDCNLAIEAALRGRGIALVRRSLAAREIAAGELLQLFAEGLATDLAYYLVYPASALDSPAARKLRSWLVAESSAARRAITLPRPPRN